MDNELDIFNDDAFSAVQMTEAVNLVPNMWGKIGALGLFTPQGVNTLSVGIEQENGVLAILPSVPRGGPATKNKSGKRALHQMNIPHFPLDDVVTPSSIQGVRGYRGESRLQTVMSVVNRRILEMKRKHDITLEWLRAGALKGIVVDADTSELVNFYTLLGVSPESVDFKFGTSTTDMKDKCTRITDHIGLNLMGDTMTGVQALCGRTWFNKFTGHKTVKDAYAHQVGINPNRDDVSDGFDFGGINFKVYIGSAPDHDANSRSFVADEEARFFPLGTSDTFAEYNAPAEMVDFANTLGLPFYASQEMLRHGKGVELYTETNPLPVCRRPGVLVKGYTSD